jgi:hypothetical protein
LPGKPLPAQDVKQDCGKHPQEALSITSIVRIRCNSPPETPAFNSL